MVLKFDLKTNYIKNQNFSIVNYLLKEFFPLKIKTDLEMCRIKITF